MQSTASIEFLQEDWVDSPGDWEETPYWLEESKKQEKKDYSTTANANTCELAWVTESKKHAKKKGTLADVAKVHKEIFSRDICTVCGFSHEESTKKQL